MENEWEIRAIAILNGGIDRDPMVGLDLAGLLRGTLMESWTALGNEQFLGMVIRHARVLLREGKINTFFPPEEEVR